MDVAALIWLLCGAGCALTLGALHIFERERKAQAIEREDEDMAGGFSVPPDLIGPLLRRSNGALMHRPRQQGKSAATAAAELLQAQLMAGLISGTEYNAAMQALINPRAGARTAASIPPEISDDRFAVDEDGLRDALARGGFDMDGYEDTFLGTGKTVTSGQTFGPAEVASLTFTPDDLLQRSLRISSASIISINQEDNTPYVHVATMNGFRRLQGIREQAVEVEFTLHSTVDALVETGTRGVLSIVLPNLNHMTFNAIVESFELNFHNSIIIKARFSRCA